MEPTFKRMPGEGKKAFAAFVVYRDMGENRSIKAAAQKIRKSTGTLATWSSLWNWRARALAWDSHLDERKREQQILAVQEMSERHAAIACMFQTKVVERLSRMTDAELDKLSGSDLLSWFAQSAKIELRARGEPDVVSSSANTISGPGGKPIQTQSQVQVIETIVRTKDEVAQALASPKAELLDSD